MPPEPFSHFDHDDTPVTNGSTLISSCTCPLVHPLSGATYLPSARIHGNVLLNLLTRQTWKAASIAQFAQQPIAPSPRSHHDKADLRQAAATYRAEVAQDWQTHRLESQVRTAIWDVAQLLPTDAIEIVPHLASSQLSAEQCAAIAEMMHRPIVSHNEKALIAGIFAAWGELFRRRIVRVWSSAQLSCKTLTLSLELRSIPSVHTSGFAELHGDRLYVAATWGLPHIFDVGLIEPDRFDLDLASHSTQTKTLGQKLCSYTLQPSLTLSSGVALTLTEVSIERQAQFALKLDDLLTLIKLAQSIRQWQHPALTTGMRIDWSFGSYCEPTAIAIQTEPEIDRNIDHTPGLENNSPPPPTSDAIALTNPAPERTTRTPPTPHNLFVHDIAPLDYTRPSCWFTETLKAKPPQPIRTAIWHGVSASGGRITAAAFVFKPFKPFKPLSASRSDSTLDVSVSPSLDRTDPKPGEIWVCTQIPATRLCDLRHAAGLVVEAGSSTSHEILLARDLGLPIVVGVVGIVNALNTGDLLEVDANTGDVMRYSGIRSSVRPSSNRNVHQRDTPQLNTDQPHTSVPPPRNDQPLPSSIAIHSEKLQHQVALRVSLSYLERNLSLERAWGGIGLLRSEMLAFTEGIELTLNPTPREYGELYRWLHQRLTLAIKLCGQRSLFYRIFDRLTPDATLLDRGIHLYLDQPTLFDLQLKVLAELHHNGHTHIRLLLPFVRSCAELEFCWQRLERLGFDRANSSIEVWIMAEVPSVLMLLDQYCQMGISGIAIGTNDLAALMLGLDREDGRSAAIVKAARPALHTAILALAATAKRHGIACQLCDDEIVDDPETLGDLLNAGVTALSVSIDRLAKAEQALAVSLGVDPGTH